MAPSSAQYQLSVEALDPSWSQAVGPYGPWQVQPSGAFQPLIVTVSKGGDLQQDILMQGSAMQARDWFEPTSFAAPATLPPSGDWLGALSGLGNADYFWFVAQSNRTLSVEVTALDELKAASAGEGAAGHRYVGAGGPRHLSRARNAGIWPSIARISA